VLGSADSGAGMMPGEQFALDSLGREVDDQRDQHNQQQRGKYVVDAKAFLRSNQERTQTVRR
jgi:hypothetical protein